MSELSALFLEQNLAEPYILTPVHLLASLIFALCLGGIMFLTYRMCHDTLTYSRQFNVTLLMLSFISTLLLALIQNRALCSGLWPLGFHRQSAHLPQGFCLPCLWPWSWLDSA